MAKFSLKAQARAETGTRAMRRLRKNGLLPAIIYGHKQESRMVSFNEREIKRFIQDGHRMLSVDIDGVEENGIVRDVQYSSNGTDLIHLDIARVDIHEKITTPVPIETIGVPKGLTSGGSLDLPKREAMVAGPASSIPEKIEINIESLDLGQVFRIKDLKPVPGCQFIDDPEQVVAAIHTKRVEEEVPAAAAADSEMPEVIGEKKDAEGGEEAKDSEEKK